MASTGRPPSAEDVLRSSFMAPRIDAVLLDLGNVLALHDNRLLFDRLAAEFGTDLAQIEARIDRGLWDRVNRGKLPGDSLRRELSKKLEREISSEAWREAWSCHFTVHDSMVALVERLVGRVRLVLVSNTHDLHVANLRPRIPVLDRFDGLVLSCETGFVKPEPEIYRRAIEVADVEASRAVFFDDVEPFVEAAKREGLHAFVFTTTDRARADLASLGLVV